MKKLRMIVTSVVVLAIIGSAFAFKAKRAILCIADISTTICQTILEDVKIVHGGGQDYHYYNGWDGDQAICVGQPNCTSTITLDNN